MPEVTVEQAMQIAIQHHQAGRFAEAEKIYQQILAGQPGHSGALHLLGVLAEQGGRSELAVQLIRQAITQKPEWLEARNNLGVALSHLGEKQQAAGQLDQAVASYREATALRPKIAVVHNNLGTAFFEIGELDQAINAFRRAIELHPGNPLFGSALLCSLHYHPSCDSTIIVTEQSLWNDRHAEPSRASIPSHTVDRNSDRRLRIGYISRDFHNHPVGRFLLPLLEHHDYQQFEIFCYSDVHEPDATTARLQSAADHWREIRGTSHVQVAEQIRSDAIDILVDLAGHTSSNRLPVFARKPAPVQVNYLGYPGSTGMKAIDYRLTDFLADPPSMTDHLHSEKLVRLPITNWCFAEFEESLPISRPAFQQRGHITFGSFSNLIKVTQPMLHLWCRILDRVPNSCLILKAAAFTAESARNRIQQIFAGHGIDSNRITLRGPQPNYASHLATYQQIDIALDTFPYHGTATTIDALWMGVPVITLAGNAHVSRVGVSLLTNLGLTELIAVTEDEYVDLAVELATDHDRLAALHQTLRERMRQSPLMNGQQFARDVEDAYRRMWSQA